MIRSLEASIVSDVLSKGLFAVDALSVDGVLGVLINHALGPVLKGVHRGILPPRSKVPVLVILSPCGNKGRHI